MGIILAETIYQLRSAIDLLDYSPAVVGGFNPDQTITDLNSILTYFPHRLDTEQVFILNVLIGKVERYKTRFNL